MKYNKKTLMLCAFFAVSLVFSVFTLAADGEYDSTTDPLISYSYLEDRLAEMESDYVQKINALTVENEELQEQLDELRGLIEELKTSGGAPSTYETVSLQKNDVIYPTGDSLEVILRSGRAVCVSSDEEKAVADITNGMDIYNFETIVYNHLIFVPANDGRGIKITSDEAIITVRGEYKVEKQ